MKQIAIKILDYYEQYCKKKRKRPYGNDLEKKLMAINPGDKGENLVRQYYLEKLTRIFKILITLMFLVAVVFIKSTTETEINNNMVERNSYGGAKKHLDLLADYSGMELDIGLDVESRKYTDSEIQQYFEKLKKELPQLIRCENGKFNLMNNLQGYPFFIRWESRNYEVLHEDGAVFNADDDFEETDVLLIAHISYEDYEEEIPITVKIYPKELSLEETQRKEIITSILDNENESEQYLQLPTSIGEKEITFKEVKPPVATILAILSMLTLVGIWIGIDNDLARRYVERNRLLCLEYSEFVSKLQLLIGSGLTLRVAFERMGEDYKLSKERNNNKSYVYEELLLCTRRIRDGVPEADCYEMFGKRCGLIQYRKLATLLVQNLRKGTSGLLISLNNETKIAFEERKQSAKKAGEEAQTKMLFPMIIMLGIVMVIIMIPAYLSFGA